MAFLFISGKTNSRQRYELWETLLIALVYSLFYLMRPLRKAISSQLALFSFELLSLKTPISRKGGASNEEVVLRNGLNRYMDV